MQKKSILNSYVNDSICGTWETLADAVYPGGSAALIASGWQVVGAEKSKWAVSIPPTWILKTTRYPAFAIFGTN
jgi:hypothetical protein